MTEPTNKDDRTVLPHGDAVSKGRAGQRARSTHEPESGDRLPIGMRLTEFEITGYVGDGGFSIVYLAWDHSLERQVALKEYMPSSLASRSSDTRVFPRSERHRDTFDAGLKSFINEGKLLAQFDHPSLVKVYRFWEAHGTAYMVMPYYEGLTLKDTVRAMSQPPDEAWLLGVLDPLMTALSVIHREQCFHRDIAPDNVLLLAGSGKPLLLDFGAARRVIGDKTQALTVILKPGYAPFEQYAEDSSMRQGAWTDVYALAAVIYWAVTGKTPPVSVGRVVNDSYVPLAQSAVGRYSTHFLAAVDRALVVLPEGRTRSIEHLREEIGLGVTSSEMRPAPAPHEDLDATIIRPTPKPAAPRMRTMPNALAPAAKNQSPQRRVDSPNPKTQATANLGASSSGNMRLWLTLVGIAVAVIGAGMWWILQPSASSASTVATMPPPRTAPAQIPEQAPIPTPASIAAPISEPIPEPIPTPIPVPAPEPAPIPPEPEKTAIKRIEKAPPKEVKPPANRDDRMSAQCRELLNRASLGDTNADLIEKMKTLRCGN